MGARSRKTEQLGSLKRHFGLVATAADEGTDAVVCLLCGKTFRAVTFSHLRARHGATGAQPVEDYKRRFKLVAATALDLRRDRRDRRIAKVKREGRRWTKRRILSDIRHRARSGRPTTFSRVPARLYAAGQLYFGSWRDAVDAAGLPPGSHRSTQTWTRMGIRAAILERRRRRASNSPAVVAKEDGPLFRSATRRYGSWHRAVRAVGIDPATYKGPWKWTPERARAWVEDRVAKGLSIRMGLVPPGLYARVRTDTGKTWRYFVESLGHAYTGPPPNQRWSREAVVSAIQARIRHGLPVTAFAVQKDQQSLKHAARQYFGSWDTALQAAGLRPRPLRRAWDEAGTLASIRARQEDGRVMRESVAAVEDERLFAAATARFGSWPAALAAAKRGPRVNPGPA